MENLPLIEIAKMNREIVGIESFQNDFSIAEMDGSKAMSENEKSIDKTPMRLNALLLVLVTGGTASLNIDYVPYEIDPNHLVTIMPTHTIQISESSSNFKGYVLIISKAFLEGCLSVKNGQSMLHYMQVRKNPCFSIESEQTDFLASYCSSMREKIRNKEHLFQKELIQNALDGFFLELGDILGRKYGVMAQPTLSRKEMLFEQFLQLLFKHCKEQHVVTFYADKLFITPQYLSLILKELTGKSANKWIDDALIVEAKVLLKAPQATVQQVADTLHFSDQSTFGKFFKKHMGISPMEYRKSC